MCHYVRVENTCETGTPDLNLAWKSLKSDAFSSKKNKNGVVFDKNDTVFDKNDTVLKGNGWESWVELKYLSKFPVKNDTKVTLNCFTKDQITWLLTRWSMKIGSAWLLVQVKDDYFLFNARAAAKVYYGVTSNEFKDLADWTGGKGFDGRKLLDVMELD